MRYIVTVFILLFIVGCNSGSDSASQQSADAQPTELSGTWVRGCEQAYYDENVVNFDVWNTITYQFDEGVFQYRINSYTDETCRSSVADLDVSAIFEYEFDRVETSARGININIYKITVGVGEAIEADYVGFYFDQDKMYPAFESNGVFNIYFNQVYSPLVGMIN